MLAHDLGVILDQVAKYALVLAAKNSRDNLWETYIFFAEDIPDRNKEKRYLGLGLTALVA